MKKLIVVISKNYKINQIITKNRYKTSYKMEGLPL